MKEFCLHLPLFIIIVDIGLFSESGYKSSLFCFFCTVRAIFSLVCLSVLIAYLCYHGQIFPQVTACTVCSFLPQHTCTHTHVNQVFHVPVEERRYNFDEPSFGGGESRQLDIVREIIERTGCDIEMSQTKDRALTIMVTGKPSMVLKARKDLLQKLQTQVRTSFFFSFRFWIRF